MEKVCKMKPYGESYNMIYLYIKATKELTKTNLINEYKILNDVNKHLISIFNS